MIVQEAVKKVLLRSDYVFQEENSGASEAGGLN